MFVDASGRRLRRVSLIAAVVVGGYAVVLGVEVLGGVVPPTALLPIGGAPAAPSQSGSPAATGAPGAIGGTDAPYAGRTAAAAVAGASAPGTTPAPTSSGAAGVSPAPSASPSPSATTRRQTAPPGQGGRPATATATGRGH